jgi:hypothetical protein
LGAAKNRSAEKYGNAALLSDLADTIRGIMHIGDPRDAPTSEGLDQEGATSMAVQNVPPHHGAAQIAALLDSPEIMGLIADLETTRWTGRRGYPIRAMVGLALAKNVYALPTWSRTVRLVGEHAALQDALGAAPSIHAAYRFTVNLGEHSAALADCLDRVLAELQGDP